MGTGQASGRRAVAVQPTETNNKISPPSSFPRSLPAATILARTGNRGKSEREERYPSCCARRRKRATASAVHVTIGAPTTNPPSLAHLLPRRDAAQRSGKTLTPKMRIAAACLSACLPRCHSKAAATADSQKLLRRRGGHTRVDGQGFPLSHHLASNPPSAPCLQRPITS